MRGMALCVAAAVLGDGLLLSIDTNDQAVRQRLAHNTSRDDRGEAENKDGGYQGEERP